MFAFSLKLNKKTDWLTNQLFANFILFFIISTFTKASYKRIISGTAKSPINPSNWNQIYILINAAKAIIPKFEEKIFSSIILLTIVITPNIKKRTVKVYNFNSSLNFPLFVCAFIMITYF